MLAGGQAEVTRRTVAGIAQSVKLLFYLLQVRTQALEQLFARFGRRHAAGGAGQQPHVEPGLEVAHRVAEGGLGDAKLSGRTGEATLAGDHHKRQQVVNVIF